MTKNRKTLIVNFSKRLKKKRINITISIFITAIILFILAIDAKESPTKEIYFLIPSAVCFSIWMIITQGADKIDHLAMELIKFAFVTIMFPHCLYFYLKVKQFSGLISILKLILFCIELFLCIYYFISKLNSIINLIKDVFKCIKLKLFKNNTVSNKTTLSIIQDITTFFVAIGSLAVAIKVIIEAIYQIINCIK